MGDNMDGYLTFQTKLEAETFSAEVKEKYFTELEALGYKRGAFGIIGKNAATGEDAPDAQQTTTWAEETLVDGKYEIANPENDPKLVKYQAELEGKYTFTKATKLVQAEEPP